MKKLILFLVLCCSAPFIGEALAQTDTTEVTDSTIYLIVKNDGSEYLGYILKRDAREVLIRTLKGMDIYIPTHEIAEIKEAQSDTYTSEGTNLGENIFSTRYSLTTNGFPMKKGSTYSYATLFSAEVHFAVTDNLGLGVMTSYLGSPIVGTVKYTIPTDNEKLKFGIGTLIGTTSWLSFGSWGALPFACVTSGTRNNNINFSLGGLYLSSSDEGIFEGASTFQPLLSIGGIAKMNRKISFVFDSIIILPNDDSDVSIIWGMPGMRFETGRDRAFQFSLNVIGSVSEGESIVFPVPMVGWFRSF